MRYGTLFSGVEGFGLGFEAAGMVPAFQCEIDPHAASVLRYRYPDVPKWDDVTEVDPDELPSVDVLAFGSPCQDLSVAGRRAGLDGDRSGLFVEAIRIADRLAPDWLVFENVPGLLSSQRGEDFAVVLEGITGFRPAVPGDGWRNAGVCIGPLRWAVWRVLDTQYFGPPQRRRRVFVVAGARGPCRPEVLFEPESVPWHPAPRREAGKGAAGGVEGGPGGAGGVAPTLTVGGRDRGAGDSYDNTPVVAHTLRGEGFDASEDGTGRGTPLVVSSGQTNAEITRDFAPTLNLNRDGAPIVLPFGTTQITSKANYSHPRPGDPCHPLAAGAHAPAVAFYSNLGTHGGGVGDDVSPTIRIGSGLGIPSPPAVASVGTVPRRLTPVECERLQGWPDDWTRYGRTPDGEMVELKDSPRYKMCGNGVSGPVAEWLGRKIMEAA